VSTEALADHDAAVAQPVLIEAVDGPGAGPKATLEQGTCFIGSDEGCEVSLKDTAVSRRHLSVELLAGAVRVRDLQSTNGTTYLGARIQQAVVPLGASIVIGRTTVRFSPAARAPLAVSGRDELEGLYGRTQPMRHVFALLERLGPADGTVLLRGETGTGKTTAARALHALGHHAAEPFVVFDCAAVNPNLLESELFGHAKGAFTGAEKARAGAAELAGHGTLLLDEVGELSPVLQPKLLRLLDQRELKRVGETHVRSVTCRIVATTARDLEAEVALGKFRKDLYFRLAAAEVRMPALRERREDIPELVQRFARAVSKVDVKLSPATVAELLGDPWPGNVRELKNAVERAIALGELGSDAAAAPGPKTFKEAREKMLFDFERDYLQALLDGQKGNVSAAARESGLSRSQFYRLLEKHKLPGG
jgi:DNA-binding NtrC family response regulator